MLRLSDPSRSFGVTAGLSGPSHAFGVTVCGDVRQTVRDAVILNEVKNLINSENSALFSSKPDYDITR